MEGPTTPYKLEHGLLELQMYRLLPQGDDVRVGGSLQQLTMGAGLFQHRMVPISWAARTKMMTAALRWSVSN
jgi:hypothetical protein